MTSKKHEVDENVVILQTHQMQEQKHPLAIENSIEGNIDYHAHTHQSPSSFEDPERCMKEKML